MASKAPELVPKKALLVVILTEGTTHTNKATKTNLDNWIASAKSPHTNTLDSEAPQTDMETFFAGDRETAVVVELATMKVLKIFKYDLAGAIAYLESLL